jgi:hydroxymethylpyrimidine pyrophosphatase-like HAD family hydrolase
MVLLGLCYVVSMIGEPKLAIFDLDGTIAEHSIINPSVIKGIKYLHKQGCISTLSMGRGYVRLKELLGPHFDEIISPNAIIILEHGTKLVDKHGNIVFGEFLLPEEIEHIVEFVRVNSALFKLASFNPIDVTRKIPVWCADERDVEAQIRQRGHYADIFTASIGELREILLKERLTNISFKLKDYIKVENLKLAFTRTQTNIIFQDGYMDLSVTI